MDRHPVNEAVTSLDDSGSEQARSGQEEARGDPRRHLLVAGTGRAGTSALVRYLTGLGLDTHVSRHGDAAHWDEAAQAGLEDIPVSSVTPDLPYVVKSPWTYEFVQEMLEDPSIVLDAAIVPVRDLVQATASRTIRQLQDRYQAVPWMTQMTTTWEHWGMTPGGSVVSLHPIDQARLLAVGFHRLIERLVQADVPIVLLAFPRFATDADYLYRKLVHLLPADIPIEQTRAVHAATFKTDSIRVGRELSGESEPDSIQGGLEGPDLRALDNAALKREVNRLRDQLASTAAQRDAALQGCDAAAQERDTALQKRDALSLERDTLQHEFESQTARANEAEARLATEEAERNRLQERHTLLTQELVTLRASWSLRMTRPLRLLASALRAGSHNRPRH